MKKYVKAKKYSQENVSQKLKANADNSSKYFLSSRLYEKGGCSFDLNNGCRGKSKH